MMIRVSVSVSPLIAVDGAEGGRTTIRIKIRIHDEDTGAVTALAPVRLPPLSVACLPTAPCGLALRCDISSNLIGGSGAAADSELGYSELTVPY